MVVFCFPSTFGVCVCVVHTFLTNSTNDYLYLNFIFDHHSRLVNMRMAKRDMIHLGPILSLAHQNSYLSYNNLTTTSVQRMKCACASICMSFVYLQFVVFIVSVSVAFIFLGMLGSIEMIGDHCLFLYFIG